MADQLGMISHVLPMVIVCVMLNSVDVKELPALSLLSARSRSTAHNLQHLFCVFKIAPTIVKRPMKTDVVLDVVFPSFLPSST
jgi:hypothetical protein